MKKLVSLVAVGSLAALVGAACGSSSKNNGFDDGNGGSSGSSGDGSSGVLGSSGSSGASGTTDLGNCGAVTQTAKGLPLDLYVVLDSSGSMMEKTGANANGPTKWASVKDALNSFVGDPKSAGIGVGLQIFPIQHPGAPSACTSNNDCNVGGVDLGRCFLKACHPANANDPIKSCDTANDCGGAACRQLGQCDITGDACLVNDPQYGACLIGSCQAILSSTCENDECVAGDYATAKVAIAALPGNAGAFSATINALPDPPPNALTPTSVAVQAGIDSAKAYANANAGHVVVVVLATDGLPTRCAPTDIPGISALAAAGVSGTPAVKTFVIGVFADAEKSVATPNLNAIANAGGTSQALIVTTSGNVTQDFQQALDTIRGTALPCEYAIPDSSGGTPDFSKVNVQYTTGGGTKNVLGYKTNAAACDANGGWYYDIDPAKGTPTKIIICPSTCDAVKKDTSGAKVDILLGCQTIVK